MYILVFILILMILVVVHEFGHFIAAKKNGVLVEEFGIGFPPRIASFKWGETLYSINLLPIGGFVKLYGEEYHEGDSQVDAKLKNRAFISKKPWQKSIIVVAGIIGNFLLAWVLISYLFTQGVPTPTNAVIVDAVSANSPARTAGLKPQDTIVSIRVGTRTLPLRTSSDLIDYSHKYAGQALVFHVRHPGGQQADITITPRVKPPAGEGPLGVVITSYINRRYPWYQAPFYGLIHSFEITRTIIVELSKTLGTFLSFKKPSVDVSGPIGIAQYTGQAIKFGNNAVLELMALLSLNLAVVNILPFPALDGGRLVFIVYEWITKRQVNKKIEQYTNLFGMAALLTLAALISINDVIKLLHK